MRTALIALAVVLLLVIGAVELMGWLFTGYWAFWDHA